MNAHRLRSQLTEMHLLSPAITNAGFVAVPCSLFGMAEPNGFQAQLYVWALAEAQRTSAADGEASSSLPELFANFN
jgi:hypothetical protein